MHILPSQPSSIAKVLDASIKLYSACFGRLMGLILTLAVFLIALGLFSDLLIGTPDTMDEDEGMAFLIVKLPLLLSVVFFMSILSFVLYSAMIVRIDNAAHQREDTVMEAFQTGLNKFLPMLVAVILYSLAVVIGFALLVIPGLILSLSLAFYLYFIVIDNLGGYASLRASHDLVWGNWWRTVAVFTVPGVVFVIIYFGLFSVVGILAATLSLDPAFMTVSNALGNLLSALITPYFFTLGYVQFHDLKLRKHGADLAVRLAK